MIFENIKEIGKKKGMSISAIEKKAKLGNGTIGGWKNSSPTVEKLGAVAKVLDTTVDELIKGETE